MYIDYLIVLENDDAVILSINQENRINRLNNADDEDLINDYIRLNYGNVDYEVYYLSDIERVTLK